MHSHILADSSKVYAPLFWAKLTKVTNNCNASCWVGMGTSTSLVFCGWPPGGVGKTVVDSDSIFIFFFAKLYLNTYFIKKYKDKPLGENFFDSLAWWCLVRFWAGLDSLHCCWVFGQKPQHNIKSSKPFKKTYKLVLWSYFYVGSVGRSGLPPTRLWDVFETNTESKRNTQYRTMPIIISIMILFSRVVFMFCFFLIK